MTGTSPAAGRYASSCAQRIAHESRSRAVRQVLSILIDATYRVVIACLDEGSIRVLAGLENDARKILKFVARVGRGHDV